MPTYTYKCKNEHITVEVRSMTEDQQVTECPECSEGLQRVWDVAPIQFKGSGWAGKR